jgi:hypothetical protein
MQSFFWSFAGGLKFNLLDHPTINVITALQQQQQQQQQQQHQFDTLNFVIVYEYR